MARGRQARFSPPELGPDDIAMLQYTGGTTGVAKGAVLLHRNVVANVLQSPENEAGTASDSCVNELPPHPTSASNDTDMSAQSLVLLYGMKGFTRVSAVRKTPLFIFCKFSVQ